MPTALDGIKVNVDMEPHGLYGKRRNQKSLEIEYTRANKDEPLGLSLVDVNSVGVVVGEVDVGSSVSQAGVLGGDIIVSVGSVWIRNVQELKEALKRLAGGAVVLQVYRTTSLPRGWRSLVDPSSGRTIYFTRARDRVTGKRKAWGYQHPLAYAALKENKTLSAVQQASQGPKVLGDNNHSFNNRKNDPNFRQQL